MTKLTQELVQSLFTYRDGNLYWKKINPHSKVKIGDIAGNIDKKDRVSIKISNKLYKAHRLIFLYHHGYLPKEIDHIDRNPLNNNINNLREVTRQENCRNRTKLKYRNNKLTTSIYKGVCWNKQIEKWIARIMISGQRINLGYFAVEKDAAKAYNNAAIKYDKKYFNLNNIRCDNK